jgi:hypothetical protein
VGFGIRYEKLAMAETVFYSKYTKLSFYSLLSILILLSAFWVWPFVRSIMINMERTAFEQRVASLQRVVEYKVAEYMAVEALTRLPELLEQNPWQWQGQKQQVENEIIEQETLDFDGMSRGSWAYESGTKRLIYKLYHDEHVINDDPLPNRIQFQLQLEVTDINNDGVYDPQQDTVTGLTLLPVFSYQWTTLGENNAG